MADIVGNINAYHDGATYSVADIYDEPSDIYIRQSEDGYCFVADGIYKVSYGLNSDTGTINNADNTSKVDPVITSDPAKFDYALDLTQNSWAVKGVQTRYGFTIRGWYYLKFSDLETAKTRHLFGSTIATPIANPGWGIRINHPANATYCYLYYAYGEAGSGKISFPLSVLDDWFHFAITFNGSNLKMFLNGICRFNAAGKYKTLMTAYSSDIKTCSMNISMGREANKAITDDSEFYCGEFQAFTSQCLHSANFTPPSRKVFLPATVPVVGNMAVYNPDVEETIALLKFDESINKDECGNTWTVYGSPTLSDEYSKFGGKSLYFDTSSALLIEDLNLVSKEYTIDYWLYAVSRTTGYKYIEWVGEKRNAHTGSRFEYNGGTGIITYSQPLNEWTHIAIVNTASNMIVFVNGVKKGTLTSSPNITKIGIGYNVYSSSATGDKFYMDEFRISNKALWTEDFTPPEQPAVKERIVTPKTYYVPFVENKADTTTPCLATRHNGKVYYAVK